MFGCGSEEEVFTSFEGGSKSSLCGLQATLTKGHAREGSYINKSLLTLGTVIGKLSDGNAVHIPFRDSKLTRLLQSSMTGSAARISVIATATPASCQAEETHNTLKFATRAKKVRRHASIRSCRCACTSDMVRG
jgi:hypothetical protein